MWSSPGLGALKLALQNGMVPNEGPKVIPVNVNLTVNASMLVDLSQQNELQQISFVQCIYVDNRNNTAFTDITVQSTNQVIRIGARKQAYVPVLAPLPNKFLISSTGAVIVPVYFLNIPMPLQVWDTTGAQAFSFNGSGSLQTADLVLDAIVTDPDALGNALAVRNISMPQTQFPFGNNSPITDRWQFACVTGGIVNTTAVPMIAAGGANIRNYMTSITLINVHATVATEVEVRDGATVIQRYMLPAVMLTSFSPTLPHPIRTTANTALNVACVTTGAQVYVSSNGYRGL